MSALNNLIALFIDPALFWELFWYLFAGVCSTAVSFVGYSVCFRKWGLGNVWSKVLSWTAAATTAFQHRPSATEHPEHRNGLI